ncbi:Protein ybcL precursor [Salmonella enterica subsp. houtenae serovar 16:z4,z32:-- str. RKS3027]|nr:Protein ybcL precursor [Salmonella enterica subsp. houtenae serovar 16:z4,z32:-- str. RKS3027]
MVNIPAQIHDLPTGADKNTLPTGVVQGRNDFGYAGFGGELGKVMLKCM